MTTFGKYELVRKLAQGGMAEVFLAQSAGPMGFSKQVVVKRILPGLNENDEFVTLFLNEARLAGQLNHANVVQLFDMGQEQGSYFLAMEYLDGPNLRDLTRAALLAGEHLPAPVAVKMISLACEGLAYAHEFVDPSGVPLNLVHRDISPHNLLTSRGGNVKVADFGIARAATIPSITKTGKIRGKLKYMSPEQLRDEPLDRRSDVWALGVTFYEVLTGSRPFEAPNEAGVINAILASQPRPLEEVLPGVPPALQPIVDRALAKRREDRYPDCRALQADLEAALIGLGAMVRGLEVAQVIARFCPPEALPAPAPAPAPAPPGRSRSLSGMPEARPRSDPGRPAVAPEAAAPTHADRPRSLSNPELPPIPPPPTRTDPDESAPGGPALTKTDPDEAAPGGPLPTHTAPTRPTSPGPLEPDELTPTGDDEVTPPSGIDLLPAAPAARGGLIDLVARHPVLAGLGVGLLAVVGLLALAWWSHQSQQRLDALTQQAQRPLPVAPRHLATDETRVKASAALPVEEPTLARAPPPRDAAPVAAPAVEPAAAGGGGGGPVVRGNCKEGKKSRFDLDCFGKGKLLTGKVGDRGGSGDDPGEVSEEPIHLGPAFGRREPTLPHGTLVVQVLTPTQVDIDDQQYGLQVHASPLEVELEPGPHLVHLWRRDGWNQTHRVNIDSKKPTTLSF